MLTKISVFLKLSIIVTVVSLLTGCAAIGTAVEHHDLQTHTYIRNSIFLAPIPYQERTIFIQVRNTSDRSDFDIGSRIADILTNRGYQVVYDPRMAHYVLQIQLLNVGRYSKTAARNVFGTPYGGALAGAAAGAAIGAAAGANVWAGGVVGAVGGTVVDNLVKDVTYQAVVDLRITEKPGYRVYGTRIVVTADQVNLTFAEAEPSLKFELVRAIAGIF